MEGGDESTELRRHPGAGRRCLDKLFNDRMDVVPRYNFA